ncbi:thioesterase family protein [Nocardia takedensis]
MTTTASANDRTTARTTGPRTGYYRRTAGDRFVPTAHAGGAWYPDEQHFSPLAGLIVHQIQRTRTERPDLSMSRVSFDIFGRIPLAEFAIQVETLRSGRSVELVQATVVAGERTVATARAWFQSGSDTGAVAGGASDRLPPPDSAAPWPLTAKWPGGYIASLDVRAIGAPRPGRATAWVRSPVPVLTGEPVDGLASYIALVDTANGIAVRRPPAEWIFPNLDLTIHLHRQPRGGWTGLDTTVVFGPTGRGLTTTVLYDTQGAIGYAQQILTVRPR